MFSYLAILLAVQQAAAYNCATHTYGTCDDGITHWYDPDDGQICDPLDCGGGRAPVKYNVPCCAAYTGTLACVTTPSYMPCFKQAATTTPVVVETPAPAPTITEQAPAYSPAYTSAEAAPTSPTAPAQTSIATSVQATSYELSFVAQTTLPSTTLSSSTAPAITSKPSATVITSSGSFSTASRAAQSTSSIYSGAAAGYNVEGIVMGVVGFAVGLFAGL